MSNQEVAFVRARLEERRAIALAASTPYESADGSPPVPAEGVHWRWGAGENFGPARVDPVVDEYVVDEDGQPASIHLLTVEEWPSTLSWPGGSRTSMMSDRIVGDVEIKSAHALHIIRNDPAAVVAEVEHDLALLDLLEATLQSHLAGSGTVRLAAGAVSRMAARYSWHPDWRPAR